LWVDFCIGVTSYLYVPILAFHLTSSTIHISHNLICSLYLWSALGSSSAHFIPLIYSFHMSKQCYSIPLDLVLFILHLELSANIFVPDSVFTFCLTISHRNFIWIACSLLPCCNIYPCFWTT
jgi:hypothetical protein